MASVVGAAGACTALHLFLGAWGVPQLLGRERWEEKMSPEDRESFVHDSVTSYFVSPLLVILYALAVRDLGGSLETRWEGGSTASRLGLAVHCGVTLYDYFFAFPLDSTKGPVYYWHHGAVLLVFLPILFTQRLQFFASAAALVEATNPLVGSLQQIDRAKLREGDGRLCGVDWNAVFVAFGALLILSWPFIRLALLPAVLVLYIRDSGTYFGGDRPLHTVTRVLGTACTVAIAFIWVLSCIWFADMVKIAWNELFGEKVDITRM